ncbi:hypothetical protein B0J15DRAFT_482131 [Fusarium solani]|uniref:Uncharacterized protein n=1 Tax=Fusarium solani TaxID=169388 RepID=A0A9P9L1L5_FUSSL|nr:uncharacterized protein B0J15DRAFT_482131 [Fusarium solani]KAH7272552.1 hypothetical protein B0J15DRAFT_482131 [Fusarium solani]
MGFDTERCLGGIVPFVMNRLMIGIYVVAFCHPKLQDFISSANTTIGFTQNTTTTDCISKQSHHTSYSPEKRHPTSSPVPPPTSQGLTRGLGTPWTTRRNSRQIHLVLLGDLPQGWDRPRLTLRSVRRADKVLASSRWRTSRWKLLSWATAHPPSAN